MNRRVALGVFAFVAMVAVFAGTAKAAEVLPDGKYKFTNKGKKVEGQMFLTLKKTSNDKQGNGIYEIKSGSGFLSAASSNEGAKVNGQAGPQGTRWVAIKNSGGWSFHHAGNGANCISITVDGDLKLSRARGTADQIWQKM